MAVRPDPKLYIHSDADGRTLAGAHMDSAGTLPVNALASLTGLLELLHDAAVPAVNLCRVAHRGTDITGLAFLLDEWPEAVAALMRATLGVPWRPASDPTQLGRLVPAHAVGPAGDGHWPRIDRARPARRRRDVLLVPAVCAGRRRWWTTTEPEGRCGPHTTSGALEVAAAALWHPQTSIGENPRMLPTPALT